VHDKALKAQNGALAHAGTAARRAAITKRIRYVLDRWVHAERL
jgi:hypothetical protein